MSVTSRVEVAFRGQFGRFQLDVSFSAPGRGVTALFGPSGCGKTTVLRCMAGLARVAQGTCIINGEAWQEGQVFRPTPARQLGYVFQEASLFPHLSVRHNLLFGAGRGRAGAIISFDEAVELLGLSDLVDRAPANLSGGERQRVAIGRALLSGPKILLMDEPLSALDRRSKDGILPFLERLHAHLPIPVIYVSHDLAEIERLADHLVLMDAGRAIAGGPLSDLQSDPRLPLAQARDPAVTLDAIVTGYDHDDGLATLSVVGGSFLVPAPGLSVGHAHRLRIAAGDVSLAREAARHTTILNILPARILEMVPSGSQEVVVVLRLGQAEGGARLLARITKRSANTLAFAKGEDVYAQIKGAALVRRSEGPNG